MRLRTNERGFKLIEFNDSGDQLCSIQESSSFEPRIWIGKNKIIPKVLIQDMDSESNLHGWVNYILPDCVKIFGRMELNQEQVKEILPYLQYFAENGCLPNEINKEKQDE